MKLVEKKNALTTPIMEAVKRGSSCSFKPTQKRQNLEDLKKKYLYIPDRKKFI